MNNDFAKGGADVRQAQQPTGMPQSLNAPKGAGAALGRLFGSETVLIENAGLNLTDAAEELGFGMASRIETFTLRQRTIRQGKLPDVPAQAEIEALFRSMQDEEAAAGLQQISRQIIALLKGQQSPRHLLRDRFSDPTKRYLATAYALNEIRKSGAAPHEVERLADFLAETEAADRAAIQAGLNTVDASGEFAENAKQGDMFRQVYRDAVIGYESFTSALDKILTQFGDEHFERGAKLLVKALSLDLNAVQPSLDKVRLNAILQDLYSLQAVNTVLVRCRMIVHNTKMAALNSSRMAPDVPETAHGRAN